MRLDSIQIQLGWASPSPRARLALAVVGPVTFRPTHRRSTVFTLLDDQKTIARPQLADKIGNPIAGEALAGPPTYMVSDPTILTIAPDADGMSCDVVTTGKLGTATLICTGSTADGTAVSGQVDFTVTTDVAATVNLAIDAPTPRDLTPEPAATT